MKPPGRPTGDARGLLAATLRQLPPLVGGSAAAAHLGTTGISGALLWSGRRGRGVALETWRLGDGRQPFESQGFVEKT